jgi:hypothetical protein
MTMRNEIFTLVVILWITSCSVSLAAPDTIMPGRSIGHIRLAESAKQAMNSLGAMAVGDGASGRFWQVWISRTPQSAKHYELDVLTIRDMSGSDLKRMHEFVEQVRVTSPWFATHQGIHVGSSLSSVITAFPKVRRLNPDVTPTKHQKLALYDDVRQGITFEFAAAKHGVPGSTKCQAILVHPKRKNVLEAPYPWYMPDNNGVLRYALVAAGPSGPVRMTEDATLPPHHPSFYDVQLNYAARRAQCIQIIGFGPVWLQLTALRERRGRDIKVGIQITDRRLIYRMLNCWHSTEHWPAHIHGKPIGVITLIPCTSPPARENSMVVLGLESKGVTTDYFRYGKGSYCGNDISTHIVLMYPGFGPRFEAFLRQMAERARVDRGGVSFFFYSEIETHPT